MSQKPNGRALPNPTVSETPAAPPPDLSGGGDAVIEAQPDGRSTRPGPQPKIRETFANPSMATAPDVKLLNERNYDAKRTKVRNLALKDMPDIALGTRLPGSAPIDTEAPEDAAPAAEVEEQETTEPALDERTAAQIAAKDRENRELRKKMRTLEQAGASDSKKLAQLREFAKTNPKGVAEYLGIDFPEYLRAVQEGKDSKLTLDEPPAKPETDEAAELRAENERLRAREAGRQVGEYVAKKVTDTRGEDGKLRWGLVARVGEEAREEAISLASREVHKMRKLTQQESNQVLEHFLDQTEAKYRRAAAAASADTPRRDKPTPRNPQKVPQGSPMAIRHAKDESDPRNRPSTSDIKARVRARLIG